ncbi:hypothetical protein GGI04_001954 [Coemansia thaxteri]|nr:hypothetical protein GGI04_001954 [Coemansia thaxteri]KAJ2472067.1 hypothetical protein GGI02_001836 [Coemansia sp. RSA 2322]KAJ2480164.1 hypothetical protein EV174_003805 [Coemansia sp. RSA 2320]
MVKFLGSLAVVAVAVISSLVSGAPLQADALARRDYAEVNHNYSTRPMQYKTVTATRYRHRPSYHSPAYSGSPNGPPPSSYHSSTYSSGSGQFPDWQNQMLSQVNSIRAEVGKGPLQLDSRLNTMAQDHSNYQDSISQMTHDDSAGSLGQRCSDVGLEWQGVAENVAWNYPDVSAVVTGWKNSPGHYQNMIGDYTVVGFGVTNLYWTQDFARL